MSAPRWSLLSSVTVVLMLCASVAPAADPAVNTWVKVSDGRIGSRAGRMLVNTPDLGKLLYLGGEAKGADEPYMAAFDPKAKAWSDFTKARPPVRRGLHCSYQTAYDPKTRKVYCLGGGTSLYVYDVPAGTWTTTKVNGALAGLSWPVVAADVAGRKLVVVGSDKRPDNVGWTRTAILDLDSGKWSALPPPGYAVVKTHQALVELSERTIDLVGRIRTAWYRDPAGVGTAAELKALDARCAELHRYPAMRGFAAAANAVAALLKERKTLDALRAARAMLRKIDLAAERQYPVPCSRRNSPLVFDKKNKVFLLFGGDHEDYLLNDTWILDLAKQQWRRAKPKVAPSPRAGHGLAYLPKSGKVVLYEGYVQPSNRDYGARPWTHVNPLQLWAYDVAAERWDLLGSWPVRRKDPPVLAAGYLYGYGSQYYNPPAVAATADDRLVLAAAGYRRRPSATYVMQVDPAKVDSAGQAKLAAAPDTRLYRKGRFLAAYCEVADAPKPTGLDKLPANRWVRLPRSPRNVAYGCRQRDWGTSVWDSANEQILLWGGGHCVRSASVIIHYSPASGRMVEGYDADEPYSANGGGGYDSSVLNRPWVGTHGYNLYAYDPNLKLVVSARGYFYDPLRMDWLRDGAAKRPFRYGWSSTVLEATPHGVVAWGARTDNSGVFGLWLLGKDRKWIDLKPKGKLFRPYCDSEGMTYDAKRDRLLMGWGAGYQKKGDGRIYEFDFKTRKFGHFMPANAEVAQMHSTREMMYLDHADWVVFPQHLSVGSGKDAKRYYRVYDCAADKYFLLDAGTDDPNTRVYAQGFCYDARRKLLYSFLTTGKAYALRIDPKTAKLVESPAPR